MEDKSSDPADIGAFGLQGLMPQSQFRSHLLDDFGLALVDTAAAPLLARRLKASRNRHGSDRLISQTAEGASDVVQGGFSRF